jgi:hypothetical protein
MFPYMKMIMLQCLAFYGICMSHKKINDDIMGNQQISWNSSYVIVDFQCTTIVPGVKEMLLPRIWLGYI